MSLQETLKTNVFSSMKAVLTRTNADNTLAGKDYYGNVTDQNISLTVNTGAGYAKTITVTDTPTAIEMGTDANIVGSYANLQFYAIMFKNNGSVKVSITGTGTVDWLTGVLYVQPGGEVVVTAPNGGDSSAYTNHDITVSVASGTAELEIIYIFGIV
jgi:hypothetical protein